MRRLLFFVIVGLGGAAILASLGIWQVQRLAWKQGVIADIEARIGAAPVALPGDPEPARDAYLPVRAAGFAGPETIRVLVSQKDVGAGYRLITPLVTRDNGTILVDLGFAPTDAADAAPPTAAVTVTGNLQWPQETDGFTPDADLENNIWFARDVAAMAAALNARPVLLVARDVSPPVPDVTPLPVDTARIPNDHLNYAITWFSLGLIWLAMSVYFLRRRAHPKGN